MKLGKSRVYSVGTALIGATILLVGINYLPYGGGTLGGQDRKLFILLASLVIAGALFRTPQNTVPEDIDGAGRILLILCLLLIAVFLLCSIWSLSVAQILH